MVSDNLEFWNKVKQPPKSALKAIEAGRLKGKSDINPQWRIQVMTEHFGQCGVGWYYEIVRMWSEKTDGGEMMAFCHINLYTKQADGWSAPICGIGGSAIVAREKSGLYANDEGYKMATTDALSVAMKQLGVAADIYLGMWDGRSYKSDDESAEHRAWIKKLKDAANVSSAELKRTHALVPPDILKVIWVPPLSVNLKYSAAEKDRLNGS